jgi:hypothetical protein
MFHLKSDQLIGLNPHECFTSKGNSPQDLDKSEAKLFPLNISLLLADTITFYAINALLL